LTRATGSKRGKRIGHARQQLGDTV